MKSLKKLKKKIIFELQRNCREIAKIIAMEIERRASLRSDEGYNSDHSELNQSNERKILESSERAQLTTEEIIEKDAIVFKQKYFVEKLINNSANGVIYKG